MDSKESFENVSWMNLTTSILYICLIVVVLVLTLTKCFSCFLKFRKTKHGKRYFEAKFGIRSNNLRSDSSNSSSSSSSSTTMSPNSSPDHEVFIPDFISKDVPSLPISPFAVNTTEFIKSVEQKT